MRRPRLVNGPYVSPLVRHAALQECLQPSGGARASGVLAGELRFGHALRLVGYARLEDVIASCVAGRRLLPLRRATRRAERVRLRPEPAIGAFARTERTSGIARRLPRPRHDVRVGDCRGEGPKARATPRGPANRWPGMYPCEGDAHAPATWGRSRHDAAGAQAGRPQGSRRGRDAGRADERAGREGLRPASAPRP